MPNINDFKLICNKSRKYFDLLTMSHGVDLSSLEETMKERMGFYIFMLENICSVKDIFDLTEMVTDTEFNKKLFNVDFEDYGIDAVQINHDDSTINLFNFKYREKFNTKKAQKINETIISTKFVNALINENLDDLKGKIKEKAEIILQKLTGNTIWKLMLYVVSNESFELSKSDGVLKQLEEMYGLEIIPIGLPYICQIMSIRPEPIDAELIVNIDAIMSFSESPISSSKSYIVRLPISEVIRVTSDNKDLRHKYNIEDLTPLSKVGLDYSVLFDNIRGLVLKSKYNDNISKSLKVEPERFFMYNNGLTITANDIDVKTVNANKKVKLIIKGFQVLNGGQTLRTIHEFNQKDVDNAERYLSSGEILVRIFKATSDEDLINKIAEYTNSQNSISNVDLKSLRSEQIQLEQHLDSYNIIYARKTGDTGLTTDKIYAHKISMERYGQVLFSIKGYPNKASNQKKQIFDKYYDFLFDENNLKIEESQIHIKRYFEVKKAYENNTTYKSSDQKVFYILYLDNHISKTIDEHIDSFEELMQQYKTTLDQPSTDARILIHKKFKEFLDEKLNITN